MNIGPYSLGPMPGSSHLQILIGSMQFMIAQFDQEI